MLKLTGITQNYAWGDTTSIATLQGREPSVQPEAEVWFGAHPNSPSGTGEGALDAVIADDPSEWLGAETAGRFGDRLPYLVKLLAARQPLSIQAHPSVAQAQEGFAREEKEGIPRDASHRNYKDDNHKPEVMIALTPFRAMAGFRPIADTARLIAAFDIPELDSARTLLVDDSLEALLNHWLTLDDPAPVADAVVRRAGEIAQDDQVGSADPELARLAENLVFIGREFPGDVGILAALVLNHIVLEPGQAVFLPAGNMHAYLEGFGVEVMASSDNVLRGGLTGKHIDVPELMHVVKFEPIADPRLAVEEKTDGGVTRRSYPIPVPDFSVTRYTLPAETGERANDVVLPDGAPLIVLNTAATLTLAQEGASPLVLGPGEAAFIGAYENPVRISAGQSAGADAFVVAPGSAETN